MDTGTTLTGPPLAVDPPVALILAAGLSIRMGGKPKALISLAGKTLLERAVFSFRKAGIERIAVVTGHGRDGVEARATALGLRCVYNPHFNEGMFSSLKVGLASLRDTCEAVFITPVDAPLFTPYSIRALLGETASLRSGIPAAVPLFSGRCGHPLLFPMTLLPDLLSFSGDHGMRGYLASLLPCEEAANALLNGQAPDRNARIKVEERAKAPHIRIVPVEDEGVISDLDTPEDVVEAEIFLAETRERTLPSRREAWNMLCAAKIPLAKKRHCVAVALGAVRLAMAMEEKGCKVSSYLAGICGLVHDMFRQEKDHAMKAAAFLQDHGWWEAAFVAGSHTSLPLGTLNNLGIPVRDGEFASPRNPAKDKEMRALLENTALCVFMADKYAFNDTFVSLRRRFGVIRDRYKGNKRAVAAIGRRWRIASGVERYLQEKLDKAPFDIVVRQGQSSMEKDIAAAMEKNFPTVEQAQNTSERESGWPHG